MSKIRITFATILFNLFLCDAILAGEEKQAKSEKTPTLSPVKQVFEPHDKNIAISVQNDGEQIIVDASFMVPVVPQQAWEVLTDFDNMHKFSTGVLSSKITGGTGNNLHVSQKRISRYGFFTFSLDSIREISLIPFAKIHERMISGSMRKMEETTQLLPEGDQTRINYRVVFIPGSWIPPLAGEVFIKQEAREQLQELVNEIIRRKQTKLANQ
jgi:carbon monoxide dehydrogenase subunit G